MTELPQKLSQKRHWGLGGPSPCPLWWSRGLQLGWRSPRCAGCRASLPQPSRPGLGPVSARSLPGLGQDAPPTAAGEPGLRPGASRSPPPGPAGSGRGRGRGRGRGEFCAGAAVVRHPSLTAEAVCAGSWWRGAGLLRTSGLGAGNQLPLPSFPPLLGSWDHRGASGPDAGALSWTVPPCSAAPGAPAPRWG